jgi:hypothetical protein
MPSIPGLPGPYRFFFYSFDCTEPVHVHVERDRSTCKFWLRPVSLAANRGFSAHEVNKIRKLVSEHREAIQNAWDEHCGGA